MRSELLHVITAIANPARWESRMRLYRDFEQHMLDSGVELTVVECAYGERPHELASRPHVQHVPVRAKTVLWQKESLINIGLAHLSTTQPGWKYVAWIDADVMFRRPNWAADAVHALQQYDVIQPWSDAYDLGPHDEHVQAHKSFCRLWWQGCPVVAEAQCWWKFDGGPYEYAHSGWAWCATRQAIEWLGGLIDTAIAGHGDHHMALGLVGRIERSVIGGLPQGYSRPLYQWQARALQHINKNLGFLWGTLEHHWHGRKADRAYVSRWEILRRHQFDPTTDLKRNVYGVWELAGNKPGLAHDLDAYFRSRNEDGNLI